MNIVADTIGPVKVIRLSGRFDNYVVPSVSDWLDKNISAASPNIIVNLSQVHFIDSTALAALVQGLNRSHQYQGEFCVCGLQPQVLMIFELTRLDKAFTIFLNEEHALYSLEN